MRRHHQCPCTCACHGEHGAGISSVYAALAQVLEYFAPTPVAYNALLRLQQVVSILSLSCPPSTLSRVVEYIAPAPAVLLHLRLSCCTSRWHKQCLTPRKHKNWSTSRLRLQPLPDLLRLQQGLNSLPVVPTVYTCTCGGVHRAGTSSLCTSCVVRGYRTRASASHQQNRGHRPCNLSLYVVPPHSRFPLATLHLQRCCFGLPCLRVLKKQLF